MDEKPKSVDFFLHGTVDERVLAMIPDVIGCANAGININLHLSTFGGSTDISLAFIQVIQEARKRVTVSTIGRGFVYSAGIYLISCGTPGHRFAYESTVFMTHKTRASLSGTADELTEGAKGIEFVEKALTRFFAEDLNTTEEAASKWLNEVNYFYPDEALRIGLINKTIPILGTDFSTATVKGEL